MKKLLKALATLAAVAMLGTSFIGCASDDDGGKPADTVPTVNWPASPTGSAGLAASLKNGLATMDAGSVTMNGTSYSSIAAALAACTAAEDYEIVLTAGKYEELLSYSGPGRVVIKGTGTAERGQDVVIFGNNSSAVNANGGQRSIFYYKGSGSLTFENLSILNTYERPGKADAQAECIQAKGTGNVAAYKCSFMSHQDTIQTVAKAWFYDCYVEGDVDFIWMEAGSKVALYENCTLVSLGDETDRAYIAAPKIDSGKAPFKGLVVLNSVVKANNPDTTLCRNPWNSSSNNGVMYNQVAYINTTPDLTGTGKVTGLAISGNDDFNKDGFAENVIGWKMDKATRNAFGLASLENSRLVTDTVKANEFNGRKAILNRFYDCDAKKYTKDTDTNWDIEALVTARSWTVAADTSKDLLPGETVVNKTMYNLMSEMCPSATDSWTTVTWTDSDTTKSSADGKVSWNKDKFKARNTDGDVMCGNGAAMTVKVSGPSLIYFILDKANTTGNYTAKIGSTVIATGNSSHGKGRANLEFIYTGSSAADIDISFDGNTYVQKLVVADLSGEKEQINSVTFSADVSPEKPVSVAAGITLEAIADIKYDSPVTSVVYAIEDAGTTGATVDASTGVVTLTAAGTFKVKATVTAGGATKTSDVVTLTALDIKVQSIKYLTSAETSAVDNLVAVCSNNDLATAGAATASDVSALLTAGDGKWVYQSDRHDGVNSTGGITFAYTDDTRGSNKIGEGYDQLYVELPITFVAKTKITEIKFYGGQHGTGNYLGAIFMKKGDGSYTDVIKDQASRSTMVVGPVTANNVFEAGETATIKIALGGKAGGITGGRSPTIGTITISCEEVK